MTIKETAGKILLYFYQLQRTVPLEVQHRQLGFIDKKNGEIALTTDKKWLTKDLLGINPAPSDILNAFMFLIDKELVKTKERATTNTRIYVGVHLTYKGIDLVEGVEHGGAGSDDFSTAFNISTEGKTNVDDLVHDNLNMLLK